MKAGLTRLCATLALALCAALPLRAQGVDPAEMMATLRIPEMIAVMQDEGVAYGDELEAELFPGAGGAAWQRKVARIYDEPALQQQFQTAFASGLADDPSAMQGIVTFFATPRGQRILALELDARIALLNEQAESAAAAAFDAMRAADDPRVALLERFAAANDLIEQNVAVNLNAGLGFYRGMAEGGAFDAAPMTGPEMLAEFRAQEAQIRADTEGWMFPFLALAYGPLPDDDLRAYTDFSETPAAQKMNTAMFAAFDQVFSRISRDLGRAAAEMLAGQDI